MKDNKIPDLINMRLRKIADGEDAIPLEQLLEITDKETLARFGKIEGEGFRSYQMFQYFKDYLNHSEIYAYNQYQYAVLTGKRKVYEERQPRYKHLIDWSWTRDGKRMESIAEYLEDKTRGKPKQVGSDWNTAKNKFFWYMRIKYGYQFGQQLLSHLITQAELDIKMSALSNLTPEIIRYLKDGAAQDFKTATETNDLMKVMKTIERILNVIGVVETKPTTNKVEINQSFLNVPKQIETTTIELNDPQDS